MHSDVRQPNPGKCSKCGMDLLPEGTRFALLRHNVNCCDLHRHRSALDCLYRVFVGVGAADRQLLHRVEFRGIARLGTFDQRIYFG
jgi:Heavy metal binding domain